MIGLVGGVAVGTQGPIGGVMTQRVGATAGSFIMHLSGLLFSVILLFARGGEKIREWNTLPWYMLAAGALGLVLYLTINVTQPRLGSLMMLVLIIIGQLLAGMLIDHFGLFGVPVRQADWVKVLGAVALLAGAYLVSK